MAEPTWSAAQEFPLTREARRRRRRRKRTAKEVSLSGEKTTTGGDWLIIQRYMAGDSSPPQTSPHQLPRFRLNTHLYQMCVGFFFIFIFLSFSATTSLPLLVPSLIPGSVWMHNPEHLDTRANCWTRWLKPKCCTRHDRSRLPRVEWWAYRSEYR